MSSWASIAKQNSSSNSADKKQPQDKIQPKLQPKLQPNLQPKLQPKLQPNIITPMNNDIELIRNKHICGVSEMYNILLDKLNNGYFTILTIDNNFRREQFINMIFSNFNIDYHIKYDNLNSDSDVQEITNSDDEEFVPTYSKFAYT
jgi:hypothetical protein